jgi:putative murein lytic transglycosylase yjbJ
MMDLSGVRQIQARIAEIEGQFALPKQDLPGADFASKLQQEIERNASVAAGKAYAADRVQQNTAAAAPSAAQKITAAEQGTLANPELARMIHTAAQKYGVDPKLVSAVAEVESGGHQDAVSSTGAVGVMQLMPETAAGLGVDPYRMESNVEGGAKYLREMLDTFEGDVKKAVAAYNAGPNAVKAYGGVPPYAETQNYVSNVLDIYH